MLISGCVSREWQLAYLFHVRWQMDSVQLEKSEADESKSIKGRMHKGRRQAVRARPASKNRRAPQVACSLRRAVCFSLGGAQLTFLTNWVCIENGLEVFVEFLNYAASVNTAMGSPNAFYIAVGVNFGMIILELAEFRRTRRHGGKQTPWDRFWFGQVRQGSSNPRNAKSQPMQAH